MDQASALQWIDGVLSAVPPGPFKRADPVSVVDQVIPEGVEALFAWHAAACNCVHGLVPMGRLLQLWEAASEVPEPETYDLLPLERQIPRMKGVLNTIRAEIAAGRFQTFEQAVQASTVGEVLNQAEQLLQGNYRAAATVLAGGALETHMRHLCERAEILTGTETGINSYLTVMDASRRNGIEVISQNDTQQVRAWATRRNDAAHRPAEYETKTTKEAVDLMINGVRLFLRTYP